MYARQISKRDSQIIAEVIKKEVFEPRRNLKTSIFLCGKDINDLNSIRYKVADVFTNRFWYSFEFDVVYPEDIFQELLYASGSTDLLSLENLLVDSVDVVVVIPESAGSIAELGAFANNEKLRRKMVCVLRKEFRKDKSFINQGPVKLIKRTNPGAIVYLDENEIGKSEYGKAHSFKMLSKDKEVEKIISAIKTVKKGIEKVPAKITLLQLDKFLLPTIYVLQPVTKFELQNIVSSATGDEANAANSTAAALAMLTRRGFVELSLDGLKLTALGKTELLSYKQKNKRDKKHSKTLAIDSLRLSIFNLKYRNKKLKVEGDF